MDPGWSEDSSKKHGRSSSYSQQTRNSETPKSDTHEFEKQLAKHSIIMNEVKGYMLVSATSKKLCETLLKSRYDDPVYTQSPLSKFLFVWNRLRTRNEYRAIRDITLLLVPSPELFFSAVTKSWNISRKKCLLIGRGADHWQDPSPDRTSLSV